MLESARVGGSIWRLASTAQHQCCPFVSSFFSDLAHNKPDTPANAWCPWVRLWRAIAQVLLQAATIVKQDIIILAVATNGEARENTVTGATCGESCQVYTQALERDGDLPVQHEERGSPGHAPVKQKRVSPSDTLDYS